MRGSRTSRGWCWSRGSRAVRVFTDDEGAEAVRYASETVALLCLFLFRRAFPSACMSIALSR